MDAAIDRRMHQAFDEAQRLQRVRERGHAALGQPPQKPLPGTPAAHVLAYRRKLDAQPTPSEPWEPIPPLPLPNFLQWGEQQRRQAQRAQQAQLAQQAQQPQQPQRTVCYSDAELPAEQERAPIPLEITVQGPQQQQQGEPQPAVPAAPPAMAAGSFQSPPPVAPSVQPFGPGLPMWPPAGLPMYPQPMFVMSCPPPVYGQQFYPQPGVPPPYVQYLPGSYAQAAWQQPPMLASPWQQPPAPPRAPVPAPPGAPPPPPQQQQQAQQAQRVVHAAPQQATPTCSLPEEGELPCSESLTDSFGYSPTEARL